VRAKTAITWWSGFVVGRPMDHLAMSKERQWESSGIGAHQDRRVTNQHPLLQIIAVIDGALASSI
jgi:hypothetical protein